MNREQNIADTKALFEGWELYQIAIANNYMIHQEIIDCLGDQLSKTGGTACSVLEIGCGDSYVISEIAKSTNIDRYVGIERLNLDGITLQTAFPTSNCSKGICTKKLVRSILDSI